jgi:hypothetical protein
LGVHGEPGRQRVFCDFHLLLQIACAISIVTVGFTDLSYLAITLVFAGIMLAGFIVNLVLGGVLALMEARSQRHMF